MMKFLSHIKQNLFAYCAIVVVWLVFFAPLIGGGQVYFQDDLKIIFYPLEVEYANFQHHFQLPEWSTYFGFGQPLLAWGQLGFFTPLHVLLRFFNVHPLTLLQISVMAYTLFGLIGMFIWLKSRKISELGAVLGAFVFVFCGFTIGHLNHVNFYTATMVLPYLLLAGGAFIERPSIRRAVIMSLVASAITLSGQPQVVVYTITLIAIILVTFFVADAYATFKTNPSTFFLWRPLSKHLKIIILTILSGALTVLLTSFATLPLLEFLPQTERADSLPISELYEFSYPGFHAVTLILPYFFGGHDNYWGPKGFQELAAFVGIVPLWLAGLALGTWRTHKKERVSAILLIVIAMLMGLGKYSFLYTFLVEHHFLQSFSTPGRFTLFLDVGIAILACLGLHDFSTGSKSQKLFLRLLPIITAFAFIALLFSPFMITIQNDVRIFTRLLELISAWEFEWIFVLIGLTVIPATLVAYRWPKTIPVIQKLLLTICVVTLVSYAFNYNPRTDRALAMSISPFIQDLADYNHSHTIPGRLYSNPELIRSNTDNTPPKRTDFISPTFITYQPFVAKNNNLSCVNVLMESTNTPNGIIIFDLYPALNQPAIRHIEIPARNVDGYDIHPFCFKPLPDSQDKTYWFGLSSDTNSNTFAFARTNTNGNDQAFYLRKPSQKLNNIEASRKQLRLVFDLSFGNSWDKESTILARHLQVSAGVSSARWIGALSIKPYREFIEAFFANDADTPFDGDGLHAIERNRALVNFTGITHFIQALPNGTTDGMLAAGYTTVNKYLTGDYEARLYYNPQAFPKAFLIDNAIPLAAADETRYNIKEKVFDPLTTIAITGPTPPNVLPVGGGAAAEGTATITNYSPTQVTVNVTSPKDVYLVVTDSTTDQWQTYINGKLAPHYIADSLFKTAIVPAGQHTVEFKYFSPATQKAGYLTLVGIAIAIIGVIPWKVKASYLPPSPVAH